MARKKRGRKKGITIYKINGRLGRKRGRRRLPKRSKRTGRFIKG